MDPIKFDEANLVLTAPPTMKDDCGDLYCHTTGDTVISKWKLTRRERLSALINGTCWVHVYTGPPHAQPVGRAVNTGPLRKVVKRETYFPPHRMKITLDCGHSMLVNKASQPTPSRRCLLCAMETTDGPDKVRRG